jgi:hypothetical protein
MSHGTVLTQAAVSGQEQWCQADVGARKTTRHQGSPLGARSDLGHAEMPTAERRRAQGKTNREIRRCLVRYVARQLYRLLETNPAFDPT